MLGIAVLAIAAMLLMVNMSSSARPTIDPNNHNAMAPADGLTQQFSGKIVSAVDELLLIVSAVGDDHRFRVAEDTTIMLNDAETSFDALVDG